ncbi:hypothetical protein ABZP36_034623 [Zizania latifolia]
MAVPLLARKIVKKRVKQFKRPHSDRYKCLKVGVRKHFLERTLGTYRAEITHNVSTEKRNEIVERAAPLDIVVTNKFARLHSQEDE